jgi:hypothetical protein
MSVMLTDARVDGRCLRAARVPDTRLARAWHAPGTHAPRSVPVIDARSRLSHEL